ncbi:amidohydrolase family protein [Humitalea sp. 24SJ18S-53]|uniref:amidohydrolase family protein n=1 Tax=Humitalea sp. 24SJ18S-53 TaxID=3422307 RepID=UPI003D66EBC1
MTINMPPPGATRSSTGPLRISGGLVLLAADDPTPRKRDLLVEGGRVTAVLEPDQPSAPADPFDASGLILIPGLVNSHVHSSGNLIRSLTDRWNLELQLNAGPAFRGVLSTREKYLTTLLGAVEMVSRGCTSCYDIFFEAPLPSAEGFGAVAAAYRDVGIRAVVAPMVSDRSFYDAVPGLLDALPQPAAARLRASPARPWQQTLAAVEAAFAAWPSSDILGFAIAPTIPMHCTDDFLRGAAAFARGNGIGLHTHLAESRVQAVYGAQVYGMSITRHLAQLGLLSGNFTGAHAVWIDAEDARILAAHGASVAHAPGANMRLGVGLAAVRMMLEAGLSVGLATDSRLCSDNLNMFEAMRLASYASRVRGYDRAPWLSTREAFALGTTGGARALGLEGRIGRLTAGHAADIVFLDRHNTNYVPLIDLVHQLVHAEDATAVRHVMIAGRMVYRDRGFPHLDLPALFAEVESAASRIRDENAPRLAEVAALEPAVLDICGCFARAPLGIERFVRDDLTCEGVTP